MRRAELTRRLTGIAGFDRPRADLEQVETPPAAATEMLAEAHQRGDLEGRSVADLGSGTGRLALGAALLGAASVVGWETDAEAVLQARRSAEGFPQVRFEEREVGPPGPDVDTILMNPPFGAQRAHADRPFWEAAFSSRAEGIYAFALSDSRSFIEGRSVAHAAQIEERRPVDWTLPRIFRHHRKPKVRLSVDLWILRRRTDR